MSPKHEVTELGVESYLANQKHKSLLRFLTCGSVDDGKSTLIGRLLHDSQQVFDDQLTALHLDNKKLGNAGDALDLALLVDGLQAEREQGITIDVAYRYFSTTKRKFIIADTPGHEQYTRNMVTGASNSDVAIILIDARYGVKTQTKRHSFLCSMLGINTFIIAINKMDAVNFEKKVYQNIKNEYLTFSQQLGVEHIHFIPLCALKGDNVVQPSEYTPYYQGPPLLQLLETLPPPTNIEFETRFAIQQVIRPNANFRGYQGTLSAGRLEVGQPIKVLPSGGCSNIKEIITFDGSLTQAQAGQAITITLNDEIDISRGDMIIADSSTIQAINQFQAKLVWLHGTPLELNHSYLVKFITKKSLAYISNINHKVDVNTLTHSPASQLELNEIATVMVNLSEPVVVDLYSQNKSTGCFILIDRITNLTVGAGIIENTSKSINSRKVDSFELELNALIRKHYPHWQALDMSKVK